MGVGFQIPIIATQATSSVADLSSATAMVPFYQTLGRAVLLLQASPQVVDSH